MIVIKRNQIIVTALVIMVAIAGYLNYTDRIGNNITSKDDPKKLANSLEPADFDYEEFAGIGILNGEIDIATNDNATVDVAQIPVVQDEAKNDSATLDGVITNEVTADKAVNNDVASNTTNQADASEPGTAVFVNNSLDNTYFVQAKLDREQARAKQKDVLTEMINNANVDKEQRAECANAMLDIQKRIEKETSAEAMIKAKGFNEVYVRIDDNTVDVVVSKDVLSEAEMAQIEDIVVRKTGMSVDNIRISPLKN